MAFEDRETDTRPEAEDVPAYLHSDTVQVEQDKRSFPLQTLRGLQKPSDVVDDAPWGPCPPGYECWTDVYEGPDGLGYVNNYETLRGATLIRKSINYGPEKHREKDWTEVVDVRI